jgi:uncharacterized protein
VAATASEAAAAAAAAAPEFEQFIYKMARKKATKAAAAKTPTSHVPSAYDNLLSEMWRAPGVLLRHLSEGHDINMPDSRGETLLYLACGSDAEALSKGADTLVKQLLQAGADPNLGDREGCTPLMLTSSPDVANCLLDHGADIERVNHKGSTALEMACGYNSLAVVKVLLRRGAVGQMLKVNKDGHTPLSAAVSNGYEDVTLLLLQHLVLQPGFDINHPRLAVTQPLLCCVATTGLCKVTEFALDHGADPNITGLNGPPLILAAKARHNNMMDLLCQRGANVQTRFGVANSLDVAVTRGDLKAVKTLIRHGADVNVRADSSYGTAVQQAAVLGNCEIVQLLLDAGAALDAAAQHDALGVCCSSLEDSTAVKVVKLLLPHCSSFADNNFELGNEMLSFAVCKGKLQVAHLLHTAGASVHYTVDNGTLMNYAAASGNLAVVKWLQSLGLDARAAWGEQGLLPLHWACVLETVVALHR